MIRTSRLLTEGICHVRTTGPPVGYLTELISFRVLIYHCSAEWTAGLRELITATHHLCTTAANDNILQRNYMIDTCRENVAKQLDLPPMCDRSFTSVTSTAVRVCARACVCAHTEEAHLFQGCVSTIKLTPNGLCVFYLQATSLRGVVVSTPSGTRGKS